MLITVYTVHAIVLGIHFVQDINGMVISYSIGYFGQPIWSSVLYIPSIGLPNAFVGPGPRTRPLLGFVGQDLAEPEVGGTFTGNTTTAAVPEKYKQNFVVLSFPLGTGHKVTARVGWR
jgi:hypothetical protein